MLRRREFSDTTDVTQSSQRSDLTFSMCKTAGQQREHDEQHTDQSVQSGELPRSGCETSIEGEGPSHVHETPSEEARINMPSDHSANVVHDIMFESSIKTRVCSESGDQCFHQQF